MSKNLYSVFGLRIRSELPLPELFPAEEGEPDVVVRLGAIAPLADEQVGYNRAREGTLLSIADVGRYLISDGREIVVAPAPGSSERDVRLYLLGSALGALLHQRGLLPLHANAIEMDGRAIAFMGHSGAGKSTMAAWFHDRGYRVLADDVCVVTFAEDGAPMAHPGIPRLRLWREALELSGRAADDYELSFGDRDKYDVPTPLRGSPEAIPLDQIFLLGRALDETGASVRCLTGVEAADALIANTYRGSYVATIGATRRHLLDCLKLVSRVKLFSAERCWGLDRFDSEAEALERFARETMAGKSA